MGYVAQNVMLTFGFYCGHLLAQTAEEERSPEFREATIWGLGQEISNSKLLAWGSGTGITDFPSVDPMDGSLSESSIRQWLEAKLQPEGLSTAAAFSTSSCCLHQGHWRKCLSMELYGQGGQWTANLEIQPVGTSIVQRYETNTGTTVSQAVKEDFENLVVTALLSWDVVKV